MADTTIKVFLGIAGNSVQGATPVSGDYKKYDSSTLPTSFIKLADITGFPELIGDMEEIESTTMSDTSRTYEAGLQSGASDNFDAQYRRELYEQMQTLIATNGRNAKYRFALLFSDSKSVFDWVGTLNVGIGAGAINEIISMPIQMAFATTPRLRIGYDGIYNESTSTITVSATTTG